MIDWSDHSTHLFAVYPSQLFYLPHLSIFQLLHFLLPLILTLPHFFPSPRFQQRNLVILPHLQLQHHHGDIILPELPMSFLQLALPHLNFLLHLLGFHKPSFPRILLLLPLHFVHIMVRGGSVREGHLQLLEMFGVLLLVLLALAREEGGKLV